MSPASTRLGLGGKGAGGWMALKLHPTKGANLSWEILYKDAVLFSTCFRPLRSHQVKKNTYADKNIESI